LISLAPGSDHFDESRHIERDQEHDHGHGDMNEEHYDSEGRQSDSTATVAALPGASDIKVHIHHVPLDAFNMARFIEVIWLFVLRLD
jgi:hypothetical protein